MLKTLSTSLPAVVLVDAQSDLDKLVDLLVGQGLAVLSESLKLAFPAKVAVSYNLRGGFASFSAA